MEAKVVLHNNSIPFWNGGYNRRENTHRPIKRCLSIHAVLTTPADNSMAEVIATDKAGVYKDNWFDRIAINHLSQTVQVTTGLRNSKSGYDSLVEVTRVVSKKFNTKQQHTLVIQSLDSAFPSPIMTLIRTILPNSKFAREYFAVFTTLFFAWLVGPCEVRESEVNGHKEKNIVHIKKCRFLEESNCVGMCVNLCKIPSQTFVKNSLGMPVDMIPNFDDMSCDMVFGQEPPAPAHDPALKQPCYKLCKSKQRHSEKCTS